VHRDLGHPGQNREDDVAQDAAGLGQLTKFVQMQPQAIVARVGVLLGDPLPGQERTQRGCPVAPAVPVAERSAEHLKAPFNATLIVPLPDR